MRIYITMKGTGVMSRGIVRMVRRAHKATQDYMTASTDQNSLYSRGLASEGYAGGYRDALSDVLLALNGVEPDRYPYRPREAKK